MTESADEGRFHRDLADIEIVAGRVAPDLLARMPRLAWYQQFGAGVDWLLRNPELERRDFVLTNTTGVHAVQIAEHVAALLLGLARRIPAALRAQDKGAWYHAARTDVRELAGGTMVLLGLGSVGRRVARLASCLDMRVVAVKRTTGAPPSGVERVATIAELDALLPGADALVVTLPLTRETRGLVDARRLALLPAGAFVTGHYGGESPHYDARCMEVFLGNLERWLTQRPLACVVDRALGY